MTFDAAQRSPVIATATEMALPHPPASVPVDQGEIEFGAYLRELCAGMSSWRAAATEIKLTCSADNALLPTMAAMQLGQVVAELIQNAFQHAFPAGRGGRIAVTFTAGSEAWRLMVEDSGIGLPVEAWQARSDGLTIVRVVTAGLGGELAFPSVTGGTRAVAVVPRAWP